MSSNKFKFNRRTPAIYIGNESVNLVWKKNIEIEERAKENTARLDAVETVASGADERSTENLARLKEVDGVANSALEKTTENAERIEILGNRVTNTNAEVRSHTERLSAVEGIAQEAKEQAGQNATRLDGVEGVANEAADLSRSNKELIGEIEGTANEANQRSKDNTGRLDTVQGVANEANERSKSNLTRLDSVDGTAKAAKTLAESNKALLNVVGGTANSAKALAESNQKLLSTVEGTANGAKALATECRTLIDGKANVGQLTFSNVHLKILGRNLYIVSPAGLLSDDDTLSFARYVRSSGRQKADAVTGKRAHYKNTGWLSPIRYYGEGPKTIVPMAMKKDKSLGDSAIEYFLIKTNAGRFYQARPTGGADIALEFLKCYEYCFNTLNFNLQLFDKKMGVCVCRNGKQLTPYLPFTVRFHNVTSGPSEEDPTKIAVDISGATAYLSRWI